MRLDEVTGDPDFDKMMSNITQPFDIDYDKIQQDLEKTFPGIDIDSRIALIDFTRYLLSTMDKGWKTPHVIDRNLERIRPYKSSGDSTVKKAINEFEALRSIPKGNQIVNSPYAHEEDVLEIQYILFGEFNGNWDDNLEDQLKLLVDGPNIK